MRIQFASKNHCAHLAKSLKRQVSPILTTAKLSECQNAVGRMMGYRNWHEFESHCTSGRDESLFDDAVTPAARAARRMQFVGALSATLDLRVDQAGSIVDRLAPMAPRAPGKASRPETGEGEIAPVLTFEGAWGTGVAVTLPFSYSPPAVTYVILGNWDGSVRLFRTPATPATADEAVGLVERNELKRDEAWDLMFGLLGYRIGGSMHAPVRVKGTANAKQSDTALASARVHVERHLDSRSFQAWARAPGHAATPWCYDALREGDALSKKRLAFSDAYAEYLFHMLGNGRDKSFSLIDGAESPRDALADWIAGDRSIDRASALRVIDRLGKMRVRSEFPDEVTKAYELLAILGPDHDPADQADLGMLQRCLGLMNSSFSGHALDQPRVIARILADAKGKGSWGACHDRMMSEVTRSVGRLLAEGIEFVDEEEHPVDVAVNFYGTTDAAMSEFAWDTVEAALALTDERVLKLHNGGLNHHADGTTILPPTAFENACGKLFLEGIGFGDFVEFCLAWHVQMHAQGHASKRKLSPLTRSAVEARLDGWRPFLRPQYRSIDIEGLLAASAEGLERQGGVIGRRWPRPAPKAPQAWDAGPTMH